MDTNNSENILYTIENKEEIFDFLKRIGKNFRLEKDDKIIIDDKFVLEEDDVISYYFDDDNIIITKFDVFVEKNILKREKTKCFLL